MCTTGWNRHRLVRVFTPALLSGVLCTAATAIPVFESPRWQLPNPDRPYEMTSGTVSYDESLFSLYDLKFQISNPSQLDMPLPRDDGRLEFDSTFDITYQAIVSFGLEPPHSLTGMGRARAVGITRPGANPPHTFPHPQVFDTELVSFSLFGLSPIPEAMIRESPTLRSTGVTIREDPCPLCLRPFSRWRISSYFDIFTEVATHGGHWSPARDAIHVEQAPDGLLPGDYNKDHVVDTGDYVVWRRSLGQIGAGLHADGNWSGQVDAGDYDVWRAHYGQVSTSGAAASAAPEPATSLLFAFGVLMAGLSRRFTPVCRHPM